MKVNEIIIESPLRIGELRVRLEDPRINQKLYRTITQRQDKELVERFNDGVELWKIEKGYETEIYGLVPEDEYVGYYVRWQHQSAPFVDADWATQVYVWAGVSPYTQGLPEYVYYHHVLSMAGTVISDAEQSPRGEQFWQRMIAIAYKNPKYKVYLVDFNRKNVSRIKQYQEYIKLYNSANSPWGDKKGYHDGLRIAISDYDLIQE